MDFEDIYIRQTLQENAPKLRDILSSCDTITISSGGVTSVLDRTVALPISAEALVLHEMGMARIVIKVRIATKPDVLSHEAYADNRPLFIKGDTMSELADSYANAAEYVSCLMKGAERNMLEWLAQELRKKQDKLRKGSPL